jgi:hypothetical protein
MPCSWKNAEWRFSSQRAEESFASWSSGASLRERALNGVSGLANALALSGRCHQQLGNFKAAIVCYETSLINEKFEKAKPFHAFLTALREDLISCYENERGLLGEQTLRGILDQAPELDASFLFPYSLDKNAIPLARLYELAPDRIRTSRTLSALQKGRPKLCAGPAKNRMSRE